MQSHLFLIYIYVCIVFCLHCAFSSISVAMFLFLSLHCVFSGISVAIVLFLSLPQPVAQNFVVSVRFVFVAVSSFGVVPSFAPYGFGERRRRGRGFLNRVGASIPGRRPRKARFGAGLRSRMQIQWQGRGLVLLRRFR